MIYFKVLKLINFFVKNYKAQEEWKQENSSNINEVIKSVLNFFYKKISQAQNRLQRTKINVHKKHLSSNINEVIKTI